MFRMKSWAVSFAGIALFVASPASAELTASDMITRINSGDKQMLIYLIGIANGIEWSNTHSTPKLFCPLGNLAITGDQNLRMLRDTVQTDPHIGTLPSGYVVLMSYIRTFPCKT